MSFLCSLREHKTGAGSPDFTFSKPSGSVVRIESTTASLYRGYCFFTCDRAWLNGKYLRFLWQWQGTYDSNVVCRALLFDGEYDRSSDVDFPSGTTMLLKGNGLLQTIANPAVRFTWATEDVLIDASGGSEDKCTVLFQVYDAWSAQSMYVDIDWIEVNTGSGGSGNLITETFDSAVTMEVTGTFGDYGYISAGNLPQLISPQGIDVVIAYGTPEVKPGLISVPGLAVVIACGTPSLMYPQAVAPAGLAVTLAYGTPSVIGLGYIRPPGLSVVIAYGNPTILKYVWHVVLDGQYLTETPEINRSFVIGRDVYGNPVWGEAQDSTEIALVGERLDFQQELALPTTAQATSTAEAILSKMRLTTKRGVILIPPNCGQELFDTVELSDAGANQSAVKFRVVGIRFEYSPKQARYEHRLILGAP